MKGSSQVIQHLNELLAAELAARDQYFIHSRMYEDWGLQKLYERISHEMDDETGHASKLIERILFLEGTPAMSGDQRPQIGADVRSMLENDLKMELGVVAALRQAIVVCESERDFQTRALLQELLTDTEEDHTYWLEQQLGLIEKVGEQNYIQSQMG